MRLVSVELENWRSHDRKKIEFDERSTVIYGPNETGKSTILEALSRGLFDRSGSRAEEIRRVTPLTALGSVSSTVKIVFDLNEERHLVEKTFNHNRGTNLYKLDGSKRMLLAQDDAADRLLIEMLEADLPTSRASKPSKWGAFYWLWTPQDNRALPSEGDPTSSLHLDQSAGAVLVTPKFLSVQERLNNRYSHHFTRTGKIKKGSPIQVTTEQLNGHMIDREEWNLKIRSVDENKQELEGKEKELPRLEDALEQSKFDLEATREEAADFSKLEGELEASRAKIREIKRNIDDATKAIEELQDSSNTIQELQRGERSFRDDLSRVEALCDRLDSELKELNNKIEKKSDELRDCDELTADARVLYTKRSVQKQMSDLNDKIERIGKLSERLDELRSKQKPLFFTQEDLDELEAMRIRINVLSQRLDESGLYVEVVPGVKDSLAVFVDGDELSEGQKTSTGTEEVTVSYEDLGEVNIRADLQKARDIKSDIERLKVTVKEALAQSAVDSLEQLKLLYSEQVEIQNEINQLSAERKGIDERSIGEMTNELELLKEKMIGYKKIERSELAKKINPTDVDLGALVNRREAERKKANDQLNDSRVEREKLSGSLESRKGEMIELRTRHEHVSDTLMKSLETQQDLIQRHGSEAIQDNLLKAEKEKLNLQKEEQATIEKRYREIEEGPINRIKTLETKIENQQEIIQNHRAAFEQLKGKIIEGSQDGSYSRLSEVESKIEALEDRLQRIRLQASSIKLLKDVLEQQYLQSLKSVTEPIRQDVERYLGYVTGDLHDRIELDDNLMPVRLSEKGLSDLGLDVEDGSSGLREALALCVRLAVAKHLSYRGSQCLMLDDPFIHVSNDRSERMIELINRVIDESSLQVVVLTHRPMEFAGFSGKIVDIQNTLSLALSHTSPSR